MPREHKMCIFDLTCNILFNEVILMTAFLPIFWRVQTAFCRFLKIPQNLSEGHTNVAKHFFQKFLKNSEDYQRLLKTFEEDLKMFWWYSKNLKATFMRQTWYQWNHQYLHSWGYEKYATWVPDVVLYKFYEWCIFHYN